jgi:hypothetical protein
MMQPSPAAPPAIAMADALDLALSGVSGTAIDVAGRGARPLIAWLRRSGHDARAMSRAAAAPRQRARTGAAATVVIAEDWIEERDPIAVFRRVKRQLAADGRLVVIAPNATHLSVRLSGAARRRPRPLYTAAEIERLLNRAGFSVIDVQRQIDPPERVRRAGGRRAAAVLDVLTESDDALTSYFVFVAVAGAAAGAAHVQARLREMAEEHALVLRQAHRLSERVSVLEARLEDHVGQTQDIGAPAGLTDARDALVAGIDTVKALVTRLEQRRYEQLIGRVRRAVSTGVPRGATVAVLTRGDDALLQFDGRRGLHFPQTDEGVYAGHHPADSKEAIARLEAVRRRGAGYLVVPATALWWLDHYREFHDYLVRVGRPISRDARTGAVFALDGGRAL